MKGRRKKASEMTLAEYIAAGVTTATETTPTTLAAEWDGEERDEKASWWQRQWMTIEMEGETA